MTLTNGDAFDGLLIDADERTIRLGSVFAVGERTRIQVDGEMFVPRLEVRYMQRVALS